MPQGEQVLVAGDDDVGRGGEGGFDEAVVVGVSCELDGLRGVTTMAARARRSTGSPASPITTCSLG